MVGMTALIFRTKQSKFVSFSFNYINYQFRSGRGSDFHFVRKFPQRRVSQNELTLNLVDQSSLANITFLSSPWKLKLPEFVTQ